MLLFAISDMASFPAFGRADSVSFSSFYFMHLANPLSYHGIHFNLVQTFLLYEFLHQNINVIYKGFRRNPDGAIYSHSVEASLTFTHFIFVQCVYALHLNHSSIEDYPPNDHFGSPFVHMCALLADIDNSGLLSFSFCRVSTPLIFFLFLFLFLFLSFFLSFSFLFSFFLFSFFFSLFLFSVDLSLARVCYIQHLPHSSQNTQTLPFDTISLYFSLCFSKFFLSSVAYFSFFISLSLSLSFSFSLYFFLLLVTFSPTQHNNLQ